MSEEINEIKLNSFTFLFLFVIISDTFVLVITGRMTWK